MIPTVAITVGATCLLYVSGLFVIWTPLPLVHLFQRYGWQGFLVGVALALVGLGFLYGFVVPSLVTSETTGMSFFALPGLGLRGYFSGGVVRGFGLLYFVYYLLIAGSLIWSQIYHYSIERTFGFSVSFPLIACFVIVVFLAAGYGFNIAAEVKGYILHILDKLVELGEPAGLKGTELLFVRSNREQIAWRLISILPAGLFAATLLTAWSNVLLARWWFPKYGFFQHLGNLSRWKVAEKWIWIAIAGGVLYFLDYYLLHSVWLGVMAANLLLALAVVYFFHGLAIIVFWLQKRTSPFLRVAVYGTIILFFQLVAIFILALGLFDVWFDFRKLTKTPSNS